MHVDLFFSYLYRCLSCTRHLWWTASSMGAFQSTEPTLTHRVLNHWFGENRAAEESSLWNEESDEYVRYVRRNFLDDVISTIRGHNDYMLRKSWDDKLALVILLDVFPRVLFRHTSDRYSGDRKARVISRFAVTEEDGINLRPVEKAFLYLPLIHSNDSGDQRCGIRALERLLSQQPHLSFIAKQINMAKRNIDPNRNRRSKSIESVIGASSNKSARLSL